MCLQTDPALTVFALSAKVEPTRDLKKEFGQVIGERGGDRSGGLGVNISFIRAGRERHKHC